jgi:hypothetical protein
MSNNERAETLWGFSIAFTICSIICGIIARPDITTIAVFGALFAIGSLVCWYLAPIGFGMGNTVNNYYTENNSHYYPRQRRAEGVETIEQLPDGTVRTTRQVQRWE